MDIKTLNELEKEYGKWSSWAIWDNADKRNTDIIRANISELNITYVIIGLNVSEPLKKAWSNFHSGGNDNKLQAAFNNSVVRGAYMTDLFKLPTPYSKDIDTYIADRKNSKKIQLQIIKFQKELKDVGINRKSKFILLGRQVKHYFTFFLSEEFYLNERIHIPHYSAYINTSKWRSIVKKELCVQRK